MDSTPENKGAGLGLYTLRLSKLWDPFTCELGVSQEKIVAWNVSYKGRYKNRGQWMESRPTLFNCDELKTIRKIEN